MQASQLYSGKPFAYIAPFQKESLPADHSATIARVEERAYRYLVNTSIPITQSDKKALVNRLAVKFDVVRSDAHQQNIPDHQVRDITVPESSNNSGARLDLSGYRSMYMPEEASLPSQNLSADFSETDTSSTTSRREYLGQASHEVVATEQSSGLVVQAHRVDTSNGSNESNQELPTKDSDCSDRSNEVCQATDNLSSFVCSGKPVKHVTPVLRESLPEDYIAIVAKLEETIYRYVDNEYFNLTQEEKAAVIRRIDEKINSNHLPPALRSLMQSFEALTSHANQQPRFDPDAAQPVSTASAHFHELRAVVMAVRLATHLDAHATITRREGHILNLPPANDTHGSVSNPFSSGDSLDTVISRMNALPRRSFLGPDHAWPTRAFLGPDHALPTRTFLGADNDDTVQGAAGDSAQAGFDFNDGIQAYLNSSSSRERSAEQILFTIQYSTKSTFLRILSRTAHNNRSGYVADFCNAALKFCGSPFGAALFNIDNDDMLRCQRVVKALDERASSQRT